MLNNKEYYVMISLDGNYFDDDGNCHVVEDFEFDD